MDKMLEDCKTLEDQRSSKIDRLQEDYLTTTDKVRQAKQSRHSHPQRGRPLTSSDLDDRRSNDSRRRRSPTSPIRDYDYSSDTDQHHYRDNQPRYHDRGAKPRQQQPSSAAVKFYDDLDGHQVHQSLRDLSSGQTRMETDLDKEIHRRNVWEAQSRNTLQDIHEAIKRPDQVMSAVDQRLQTIKDELHTERQQLKHDDVGKISSVLQAALTAQTDAQEETRLRSQLDSQNELRDQLSRVSADRDRLRQALANQEESVRESRRQRALAERDREQRDQETGRLDREVRELRAQVGKSAAVVGEYREIKRDLDKSERQRLQLSDHIDTLTKEADNKEKYTAKIITELQETRERFRTAEAEVQQLRAQFKDTKASLQAKTGEADTLTRNLHDTAAQLTASEARKEEMRVRAQETVRQWKAKCKKLERDVDRYRHSTEQATARCEQLIKDAEQSRAQGTTAAHQLEHIKREFSEMIAIRAQQDEQVRLKDIEVNELKSYKLDLERDLRDCKLILERLEYELHAAKEHSATVNEEKLQLQDRLGAVESAQKLGQGQMSLLQREVKEASQIKVDLSNRVADVTSERHELKVALLESRKLEQAAREEVDKLMRLLAEEKERCMRTSTEIQAELETKKLELHEERSICKLLKKQQDKLKQEVSRLNKELGIAKDVELQLMGVKNSMHKRQKDFENLFNTVACEVDDLVHGVNALDSTDSNKAISMTKAMVSELQKSFSKSPQYNHSSSHRLSNERSPNMKSSHRKVKFEEDSSRPKSPKSPKSPERGCLVNRDRKTPPPLSLSDEEFASSFLPRNISGII